MNGYMNDFYKALEQLTVDDLRQIHQSVSDGSADSKRKAMLEILGGIAEGWPFEEVHSVKLDDSQVQDLKSRGFGVFADSSQKGCYHVNVELSEKAGSAQG
ncbi:MAG: hypothetical protein SOI56_08230 [Eubacteriales bacterium]|jgi:hypothetical protein